MMMTTVIKWIQVKCCVNVVADLLFISDECNDTLILKSSTLGSTETTSEMSEMFPTYVTSGHQPREGLVVWLKDQNTKDDEVFRLSEQHDQTLSHQLTNTVSTYTIIHPSIYLSGEFPLGYDKKKGEWLLIKI